MFVQKNGVWKLPFVVVCHDILCLKDEKSKPNAETKTRKFIGLIGITPESRMTSLETQSDLFLFFLHLCAGGEGVRELDVWLPILLASFLLATRNSKIAHCSTFNRYCFNIFHIVIRDNNLLINAEWNHPVFNIYLKFSFIFAYKQT